MAIDLVLAIEESFLLDRIGDNDAFPLFSLDGVFMLFVSRLARMVLYLSRRGLRVWVCKRLDVGFAIFLRLDSYWDSIIVI